MRLKSFIVASLMSCAFLPTISAQSLLPLVPLPKTVSQNVGSFTFVNGMELSYPVYSGDSVKKVCARFVDDFKKSTGLKLKLSTNVGTAIRLRLDADKPLEGYSLNVAASGITIRASHPAGFFYALQTLKQLMPCNVMAGVSDKAVKTWTAPVVDINDEPRFGWRGFMLDEGRHFYGKNTVKQVLDILSIYKMNRFHWHLTEDQGWRIEIKKYPKLTSVGAWRNSKDLAWGATKEDGIHYGGYYTQDDVKEIVKYAHDRFIEIIPEIDIPGHSQAAVASYPEFLACDPEAKHEVWKSQGVSTDIINVCNPKAVQFAKDVVDELTQLFPYGYIHVGGDECPMEKWKKNQACKDTLAKLGSTNFRDLQLHFYKQLQEHIAKKPVSQQRKLIFWNEVLDGNLSYLKDPTIMCWIGGEEKAAANNFKIIHTPYIPYYINRKQSTDPGEPATQGTGTETVKAVYNHVPNAKLEKNYLGVQGNFWTEWVINPSWIEYLMLPRVAALAEAGWTPQVERNYTNFVERISADTTLYKLRGWDYGKHIFKGKK